MFNPWVSWCLLQFSLTLIVNCTPIDPASKLERRQLDIGVVSGIDWRDHSGMRISEIKLGDRPKDVPGNVPVRREIRDLKDNFPEQWNLYLLALSSLQWTQQTDPRSYYGLSSE